MIHQDAHYTRDYDDLEPTEKFDDVPPLEFWNYEGILVRYASTHKENRCGMPKGMLKELFETVAPGHRDSITIDLKENSPARLRKNVWEPIEHVMCDLHRRSWALARWPELQVVQQTELVDLEAFASTANEPLR